MHFFCKILTSHIRIRLRAEIRNMTANILSKEYAFLTLVMYTPKPLKPPSHSEMTALTTAYETEILRLAKKSPSAAGNLT